MIYYILVGILALFLFICLTGRDLVEYDYMHYEKHLEWVIKQEEVEHARIIDQRISVLFGFSTDYKECDETNPPISLVSLGFQGGCMRLYGTTAGKESELFIINKN